LPQTACDTIRIGDGRTCYSLSRLRRLAALYCDSLQASAVSVWPLDSCGYDAITGEPMARNAWAVCCRFAAPQDSVQPQPCIVDTLSVPCAGDIKIAAAGHCKAIGAMMQNLQILRGCSSIQGMWTVAVSCCPALDAAR
jgi:hypothetical protein